MKELNGETLSEMLFRKFKANGICLKELTGLDYIKPIPYVGKPPNFTITKRMLLEMGFEDRYSHPLGIIYTNTKYLNSGVCLFEISEGEFMVEYIEPQGTGKRVETIYEAMDHIKK